GPREQLEELRVQGRLTAGELKNFDTALAIDHALDAALEVAERHGIYLLTGAHRRVGVASRTGQVARVHDLDQRQAVGEFLERAIASPRGIPAERTADCAIAHATGALIGI